jgi:hypothetical protein
MNDLNSGLKVCLRDRELNDNQCCARDPGWLMQPAVMQVLGFGLELTLDKHAVFGFGTQQSDCDNQSGTGIVVVGVQFVQVAL